MPDYAVTGRVEGTLEVTGVGPEPVQGPITGTVTIDLGEAVTVGPAAPTAPTVGTQWFDTTAAQLKIWNGSAWVLAGGPGGAVVGPTPPSTPTMGEQWFNPVTGLLSVWTGTKWAVVGGSTTSNIAPTNPSIGNLWYDTSAGALGALKVWNGTAWVLVNAPTTGSTAPTSPSLGDLWYNTTTRQLMAWNGSAWAAVGSGTLPMGVTDGSSAAPGQVGEYLVISSSLPGGGGGGSPLASFQTDSGYQVMATLALSPGDWTVGAGVDFWIGPGPGLPGPTMVESYFAYLGRPVANPDALDTAPDVAFSGMLAGGVGSEYELTFGPIRINTTAPISVVSSVIIQSVAGTPTQAGAKYTLWARRTR